VKVDRSQRFRKEKQKKKTRKEKERKGKKEKKRVKEEGNRTIFAKNGISEKVAFQRPKLCSKG